MCIVQYRVTCLRTMVERDKRGDAMTNVVTLHGKRGDAMTNRTTLSRDYVCSKCGEPAMITTGGAGYLCPSCGLDHLKRQRRLVIDPDNRW